MNQRDLIMAEKSAYGVHGHQDIARLESAGVVAPVFSRWMSSHNRSCLSGLVRARFLEHVVNRFFRFCGETEARLDEKLIN